MYWFVYVSTKRIKRQRRKPTDRTNETKQPIYRIPRIDCFDDAYFFDVQGETRQNDKSNLDQPGGGADTP